MKHKGQKLGLIILGVAILLGGSFLLFKKQNTYSYSENTHQLIAEQAVKLYHQIYGQWLSSQEIEWVKQGANNEDTPPRWVNHFYDPITGQGWNAQRMGQVPSAILKLFSKISLSQQDPLSSLNWLHNQAVQDKYQLYEGDRTFERAISDYAKGDKQRAFQSLGHSLHLIADATVPAHTRQDTHVDALGDPGEPYEKWVKEQTNQKGLAIFADLAGLANNYQPICQGVDDCLKKSAQYSNANFFSEDTIFDEAYHNPQPDKVVPETVGDNNLEWGYKSDGSGDYKLFLRTCGFNIWKKGICEQSFTVAKDVIEQDYWSRLSRQALLASIETIHDFKIQTDNAKQNPPQEKQVSGQSQSNQSLIGLFGNNMPIIGQQILDKAPVVSPYGELVRVGNFLTRLWNKASGLLSSISDAFFPAQDQINVSVTPPPTNNSQPVSTNSNQTNNQSANTGSQQNQSSSPVLKTPAPQPTQLPKLSPVLSQKNPVPSQAIITQADEDSVATDNNQTQNNIPVKPTTPTLSKIKITKYSVPLSAQTPPLVPPTSANNPIDNQTSAQATTTPTSTATSTPTTLTPPTILSPANQSQTNTDLITLQGQTSTTTTKVFMEINNNASSTQETIVQPDGTWQKEINLSAGQNNIKIWGQDAQEQKSAEVFWQIIYDTQGPEIVLTLLDYQMTSGEITLSWQSATSTPPTDVAQYLLQYQISGGAWQDLWQTATSTQKTFSGFMDGQYVFRACGQDQLGNQGAWQYVNMFFNHRPVVINEVAWMGTLADYNDEWLELYNLTDQTIDLIGWTLSAQDGSPSTTLKGFIKPNGYYLLERTNDTTIKDIPADLIYTGALNNTINSGDSLTLKDNLGNVVDSFDFISGWPAGDNTAKLSMEKIRPQDDGSLADSWMSFSGIWQGFLDANSLRLLGTPGAANSFQANGGTLLANGLIITGTVHWTKKFSPYILPRNASDFVTVAAGAKLIIDPGVIVKMPPHYLGLRVAGILEALATDQEPIIFEPQTEQDHWSVILFDPASQANFNKVIFQSAGAEGFYADGLAQVITKAAIVANQTSLSIQNCSFDDLVNGAIDAKDISGTITGNQFYGGQAQIIINGGQPVISANLFGGATMFGYGIMIYSGQPQILNNQFDGVGTIAWLGGGAPIFSGNTSQNTQRHNGILVDDRARFGENITWQNNFPYILEVNFRDQMRVLAGAVLTIEPGTVVKVASGAPVGGYEAMIIEGSLKAQASTSTPIVFTSIRDDLFGGDTNCDAGATTPVPDSWRGLYFTNSSSGSILNGVLFRYAYADDAVIKESDGVDLTLGEVGYDY